MNTKTALIIGASAVLCTAIVSLAPEHLWEVVKTAGVTLWILFIFWLAAA